MPETKNTNANHDFRLFGFTDDTQYLNMIKNRPKLSIVPAANKRIIMQRAGTSFFISALVGAILLPITINLGRDMFSPILYPTRKSFEFKSDPYSGKVHCTYQDVGYKQSGY